jgi:signal transduction histidine kinase
VRWTRSQIGDVLLASALMVVGVLGTLGADHVSDDDLPVDARGLLLVVVTVAVLVVRRRWPLATLGVAAVATSTYLVLGYPYGPILFAFLVAVYTVARHLPFTPAIVASALALVVILIHLPFRDSPLGFFGVVPGSAWVVVPFAIGVTLRLAGQAADQRRAELVRQRVYDERLRVAQEVHDVVGHGLAAIKMQADIALHVLPKQPAQAERALDAISRTSSEALDELRATLTSVRQPGAEAPRAPVPGLGRVDELTSRMSESGIRVTVERTGTPQAVPRAVDLVGYRVVQESLTNVLRHAGSAVAEVRICYEADAVTITVANPGGEAPVAGDGTGLGIAGMRERVTALGGAFHAAPTTDGGFEVRARLPLGGEQ